MSDTVDSQLAQMKAEISALTSKVADADLTITTFAGALAKAIAASSAKGLTPEQLQEFNDLHASVTSATTSLDDTIKANPLPTEIPAPVAEPTP